MRVACALFPFLVLLGRGPALAQAIPPTCATRVHFAGAEGGASESWRSAYRALLTEAVEQGLVDAAELAQMGLSGSFFALTHGPSQKQVYREALEQVAALAGRNESDGAVQVAVRAEWEAVQRRFSGIEQAATTARRITPRGSKTPIALFEKATHLRSAHFLGDTHLVVGSNPDATWLWDMAANETRALHEFEGAEDSKSTVGRKGGAALQLHLSDEEREKMAAQPGVLVRGAIPGALYGGFDSSGSRLVCVMARGVIASHDEGAPMANLHYGLSVPQFGAFAAVDRAREFYVTLGTQSFFWDADMQPQTIPESDPFVASATAFHPAHGGTRAKGAGRLRIWQPEGTRTFHDQQRISAMAFNREGDRFALGTDDGEIRLFDAPGFKPLGQWKAHSERVSNLEFSPTGEFLLTVSCSANEVRVWEPETMVKR